MTDWFPLNPRDFLHGRQDSGSAVQGVASAGHKANLKLPLMQERPFDAVIGRSARGHVCAIAYSAERS